MPNDPVLSAAIALRLSLASAPLPYPHRPILQRSIARRIPSRSRGADKPRQSDQPMPAHMRAPVSNRPKNLLAQECLRFSYLFPHSKLLLPYIGQQTLIHSYLEHLSSKSIPWSATLKGFAYSADALDLDFCFYQPFLRNETQLEAELFTYPLHPTILGHNAADDPAELLITTDRDHPIEQFCSQPMQLVSVADQNRELRLVPVMQLAQTADRNNFSVAGLATFYHQGHFTIIVDKTYSLKTLVGDTLRKLHRGEVTPIDALF